MNFTISNYYKHNIDALNILYLCFKNIDIFIKNNIYNYLYLENTDFALFEQNDEQPLEPLIRFLSKYCKNTNSIKFNKILRDIHNVPNSNTIKLDKCIKFLKKKFRFEIMDLEELLNNINDKCAFLNINLSIVKYYDNNILFLNSLKDYVLSPIDTEIHLEYLIIKKSRYNLINNSYEKYLFNYNKILTFEINRLDNYDNLNFNSIIIPIMLDLPDFVFYNKYKQKYILIGAILLDEEYGYTLIMKIKYNYYHFVNNKIIELDYNYYNILNKHCIRLFYDECFI